MHRLVLFAALGLLISACGPKSPAEPPANPAAAAQVGDAERLPNTLPPPGAEPRFIGRWSATADGCSDPAWIFHARQVDTQGEVSCTFQDVTDIPGGYQINAMCSAETAPASYRIQLTFAESARAMMIAGGPWPAPTSLVYCGPLPSP